MTIPDREHTEVVDLLESLCVGQITSSESRRLQELALNSAEVRDLYVRYIQIHASLQWVCGESAL